MILPKRSSRRDGLTAPEAVGCWCAYLQGSLTSLVLGPYLVHGRWHAGVSGL